MEKQLRCRDCKFCWPSVLVVRCGHPKQYPRKVNPGWFAGKCFVYKDK